MKIRQLSKSLAISLGVISSIGCHSSETNDVRKSISAIELQKDFEILRSTLRSYHPGLYRYHDAATIEQYLTQLQTNLNQDLSTSEVYLAISKFTASLKCGHTFCNYNNQSASIKDSIFFLPDKLPFTFFLFEKRMFVDKNLSGSSEVERGAEIISIDSTPAAAIVDTLLLYMKGDGSNDGKRLSDLTLSGLGKNEPFDVFFPILFPPKNNEYKLMIQRRGSANKTQVNVAAISRSNRFRLMEQRYGKQPSTYDDLWNFRIIADKTAYLQLGTFVVNRMTIDWKGFLSSSFKEIHEKKIANLIIDIRGNEGGDDEVNLELLEYLASKPIALPPYKELLVYERVSDELRPYLNTWDDEFYDRTGELTNLNNGFYTWKKQRSNPIRISQNTNAFAGKVYLLVNAANSSATFFLATALKENRIATLVGTETGGNRKGTNGGQIFFLRLPNSKIEIDIPLIGYYPLSEQPDQGLLPDIAVKPALENLLDSKDAELDTVLKLISR